MEASRGLGKEHEVDAPEATINEKVVRFMVRAGDLTREQ